MGNDDSLFLNLMKIVDACIENHGFGVEREYLTELMPYEIVDRLLDFAVETNLIYLEDGRYKPQFGHLFTCTACRLDRYLAGEFSPGGKYSEYTAEGDPK